MTQSALGSDLSPSCTQPRSDPLVFQPRCVMCHATSRDPVLLHASMCLHALTHECVAPEGPCMFPAYIPLLMIPYISPPLYPETN